ncbi:MAG: hypothetical protein LAT63_07395 [Marinobacter sp.]|nr:hypothetical protein [Marinobacter sp.]
MKSLQHRSLIIPALLAASLLTAPLAMAAQHGQQRGADTQEQHSERQYKRGDKHHRGERHAKREQHFERMAEHLQLTDQQRGDMRAIHQRAGEQRQANREAMLNILTPEQREKMDDMRAERRQAWRERRGEQ